MSYEFAELVDNAVAEAPPLCVKQIDKLTVLFATPIAATERYAA